MADNPTYEELEQKVRDLEKIVFKHQRVEKALQESENRFRLLYDRAPLGYQSLDMNGNFVEVNQAWLDALGYTREEIIGKNFGEFLHPDWTDHFKENFPRFKALGEVLGVEFEMVKKDGSLILVSFNGKIGLNEKGEFKQTHCILHDITEQRRSFEALKQSEEKYRSLFNDALEMIHIADKNGTIIDANPVELEKMGYTRNEYLGKNILEIIHPDHQSVAKTKLENVIKGVEVKAYETALITKNSEKIDVEINAVPQRENGEITAVRVILRDITERKLAEKENAKLQIQLQQAQKMEAIGTLAGGISHDFNNILSAVFGYTELAMEHVEKGSMMEDWLREVITAAKRAKDLVQQILTFSRQSEQELKPVLLKIIIKEALRLLRTSLPTTIEIRQNIENNSLVMSDPTQLHQIVMNLCANAGHAMQETGGVLHVELESMELDSEFVAMHHKMEPGPYVQLTVSDSGRGMGQDILDRIFDPFFTTKQKGEGTGMGLSVVHGIVKSYGGSINVYSEPGKGSTFKIFLPAIEKRVEPESRVAKPMPQGTEHILFIDDEQQLVNIGKQHLESLGYKVTTRISSVEALKLFEARPGTYDLVVTDMTMPHMTGDELAQKIMDIRPDIPVIICTGFSVRITEERAKNLGIRGIVSKPILKTDLAETVRKALDER